jgi:hypothetical protein
MTTSRTGLAAGLPIDAPTLEMEILTALLQVRNSDARRTGDGYRKKQVAAILSALLGSEMLQRHLGDDDADFVEMIADATAAVATHLSEVERPTTRLEDDILTRLREVPTASHLKTLYHEDRDAECVRRRGLIAALLGAATSNTFNHPVTEEIIIDPDDQGQQNLHDLSAALRDFYFDLERLDAGRDATHCLAKAQSRPVDYVEPETNRDTLIWAIVAIEVGAGHPTYRSQAKRCEFVSEYTECKASTLGQYLKELRGGSVKVKKFSERERLIFNERTARVRSIGAKNGQGLELLLPLLYGRMKTALPNWPSAARMKNARKVTSSD